MIGMRCFSLDDSTDETPRIIDRLAKRPGISVRLLHRSPEDRCGGLSGAVVAGMQRCQAATVVVMDGDLQHPPKTVPLLLAALEGHDVAIASRYCDGGAAGGLKGWWRCVVSRGATWMARALFPRRLHACSDPMTGFFAVRLDTIELDRLQPRDSRFCLSFLLATLCTSPKSPLSSVSVRRGSPKPRYGRGPVSRWQMLNLRLGRAMKFGVVGGTGVVVNLLVMAALLSARAALPLGRASSRPRWLSPATSCCRSGLSSPTGEPRRCAVGVPGSRSSSTTSSALRDCPYWSLPVSAVGLAELPAQFLTLVLTFGVRFAFMSHFVYRNDVDPSRS